MDDRRELVACVALALCPDGLFVAESTRKLNDDFEVTGESKLKLREGDIVVGVKRVVQADPEVNIQETRVLDLATRIPWSVVTSKFGDRLLTEIEEPFYDPDQDEVRVVTTWRLDGRVLRISNAELKTPDAPLVFWRWIERQVNTYQPVVRDRYKTFLEALCLGIRRYLIAVRRSESKPVDLPALFAESTRVANFRSIGADECGQTAVLALIPQPVPVVPEVQEKG